VDSEVIAEDSANPMEIAVVMVVAEEAIMAITAMVNLLVSKIRINS